MTQSHSELKAVKQRVSSSFGAEDKEHATKYLDWLFIAIADYAQNVRRLVVLMLALVAAFELVNGPGATEISLGSFHIYRGSIVLTFVPTLVAYLYLQIWISTIRADDVARAFSESFWQWWPKGKENSLEEFVMPSTPLYWNVSLPFLNKSMVSYRRHKAEQNISYIFAGALLVGVLLFEAQAYYALYSSHIVRHYYYYWAISLAITLLCFGAVIWYLVSTEDASK